MRELCPMFPGLAPMSELARESPHTLQWAAAAASGHLDAGDMPPRVGNTLVITKPRPLTKPTFRSAWGWPSTGQKSQGSSH